VTLPVLAPGLELTAVAALADPGALVCYADKTPVIVTRIGATIAAFHNLCPHAGYRLERADGRILIQEGRYIVCGGHGASFTLDDGACAGGPCNGAALAGIAIIVRDGLVLTA
jgi:nitrite reductase/ring-hydroxylating ferredoxin subunit